MAEVASRPSASDAKPNFGHHHHRKRSFSHSSSNSPRSLTETKPPSNTTTTTGTPPNASPLKPKSPSIVVADRRDGFQDTIKQSSMLHSLLSEPVKFIKSSQSHSQDHSNMGFVPINHHSPDDNDALKSTADRLSPSVKLARANLSKPLPSSSSVSMSPSIHGLSKASASSSPDKKQSKPSSRELYPYRISLRFPAKVGQKAAGLNNHGNTCYMNSVMQALAHTPPLAFALLSQDVADLEGQWGGPSKASNFDAAASMQAFVRRSLQGSKSTTSPFEFNKNLKAFARPLRQGRQEDSHEYLRFLLEAMQQCCLSKAPKSLKPDDPLRQTTFVHKIFGGRLRSRVTCHACKHNSDTFDPYMDLSLDVRKGIDSLTDALSAFTAKDRLTGSEKYRCDSCKRKVEATKQFTIDSTPPALTVHLKRFTAFGGKISKPIGFEETLNLSPYLSDRSASARYRLYAVVHHYGSGPNSGHYVASVKSPSGRWTRMDDSFVSEMSSGAPVGDKSAYILFYLREKDESLEKAIASLRHQSHGGPNFTKDAGGPHSKKRKSPEEEEEMEEEESREEERVGPNQKPPKKSMSKQRMKEMVERERREKKLLASSPKEEEADPGPNSIVRGKASDERISSRPASSDTFFGTSGGGGGSTKPFGNPFSFPPVGLGSGADDGKHDDELGSAINREEYESLIGGGGSGGSSANKRRLPDPEVGFDEEEEEEGKKDERQGHDHPSPLSKKERRILKKQRQQQQRREGLHDSLIHSPTSPPSSKRGIPSSPYALANLGTSSSSSSPKPQQLQHHHRDGGEGDRKKRKKNKDPRNSNPSIRFPSGLASRMKRKH
ncbi:cysteine proteinase [Violaceomyces palustris]|uniref:Cysteine proteinase n=1 Tax=Violaceomyces palustris TaxID=1673888 RepID=A0ACD0NW84_9BASI|nr:cysteine proteinase [Violaceomyces palustris]